MGRKDVVLSKKTDKAGQYNGTGTFDPGATYLPGQSSFGCQIDHLELMGKRRVRSITTLDARELKNRLVALHIAKLASHMALETVTLESCYCKQLPLVQNYHAFFSVKKYLNICMITFCITKRVYFSLEM